MWRQQQGPGRPDDSLAALQDPVKARILAYLAQERTAAAPKIGFDLKLSLADLGKALRELQDAGLVDEVRGATKQAAQVQGPPSGQGTFILTPRGIEVTRLLHRP